MGFKSIVGYLDFPTAESVDVWRELVVDPLGYKDPADEAWPDVSQRVTDTLSSFVASTASYERPEELPRATVAQHLAAVNFAGFELTVELQGQRLFVYGATRLEDRNGYYSHLLLLAYCAGARVGAAGQLYAIGVSSDEYFGGYLDFALAVDDGLVRTYSPPDRLVKSALEAARLGVPLPSMIPPDYVKMCSPPPGQQLPDDANDQDRASTSAAQEMVVDDLELDFSHLRVDELSSHYSLKGRRRSDTKRRPKWSDVEAALEALAAKKVDSVWLTLEEEIGRPPSLFAMEVGKRSDQFDLGFVSEQHELWPGEEDYEIGAVKRIFELFFRQQRLAAEDGWQ